MEPKQQFSQRLWLSVSDSPALLLAHYQTALAHHLLGGILAPGVTYQEVVTLLDKHGTLRTRCSVIQILLSLNTSCLGTSAATCLGTERQSCPRSLHLAVPCQLCLLNISNSSTISTSFLCLRRIIWVPEVPHTFLCWFVSLVRLFSGS